jgi:transketolase
MRLMMDQTLTQMADHDADLRLVVADVGSFKKFRQAHDEKFINVGVAEANAISIAAGLASQGKRVFVYGVAGFILYRAFEQIKFNIGYWQQSICMIGTGFGWRYHKLGRGHMTVDDIALMSLIPQMDLFTPTSAKRLADVLRDQRTGPCYIRMGDYAEEHPVDSMPKTAKDAMVFSMGDMTQRCYHAVQTLRHEGWDVGLIGFECLSEEVIKETLAGLPSCRYIVIEDHCHTGGLAAMCLALGFAIDLHIHLPINVEKITCSEEALLSFYGFDTPSLIDRIKGFLSLKLHD